MTDQLAKDAPLVTVGMPVFNGATVLRRALDSVCNQTYRNLEIIISDNASTDDTQAICLEYAAKDQRIRHVRNAENVGLTGNFRRVLALASGEYFMWACADDVRPSRAVESCLGALRQRNQAVMAYGDILLRLEGRKDFVSIPSDLGAHGSSTSDRIRKYTVCLEHNAVLYGLYRTHALRQGVFGSHFGQDYLLCLQMCLYGPLEHVKEPMIIYSQRTTTPCGNPMYADAPLAVAGLFQPRGISRKKCWVVLFKGWWYLISAAGASLPHRIAAAMIHVLAFARRYRLQLSKETIYLLCRGIRRMPNLPYRAARRLATHLGA